MIIHIYHYFSGFKQAVETVKSLIITLALMDKQISVKQAVELSSLEQEYQVTLLQQDSRSSRKFLILHIVVYAGC